MHADKRYCSYNVTHIWYMTGTGLYQLRAEHAGISCCSAYVTYLLKWCNSWCGLCNGLRQGSCSREEMTTATESDTLQHTNTSGDWHMTNIDQWRVTHYDTHSSVKSDTLGHTFTSEEWHIMTHTHQSRVEHAVISKISTFAQAFIEEWLSSVTIT